MERVGGARTREQRYEEREEKRRDGRSCVQGTEVKKNGEEDRGGSEFELD